MLLIYMDLHLLRFFRESGEMGRNTEKGSLHIPMAKLVMDCTKMTGGFLRYLSSPGYYQVSRVHLRKIADSWKKYSENNHYCFFHFNINSSYFKTGGGAECGWWI